MIDLEKQKQRFKNHKATLTDYGNVKILDFKNPADNTYRIRFLFEEDYYRLHISGDLGELIATNYTNMTYEHFDDFVNNAGYFEEKIDCHSRALYYFDLEKARKELYDYLNKQGYFDNYEDEDSEDVDNILYEILEDFDDIKGIGEKGYERFLEIDPEAWQIAYELGKERTGIIELYLMAFKLAKGDLEC